MPALIGFQLHFSDGHDKKTSPLVETGDAVDTFLFPLSGCAAFFTLERPAPLWRLRLTANSETDRRRVAE
jgi:hypothetical protein